MRPALLFAIFYLLINVLLCRHDLRSGLLPDRYTCPLLWGGLLFHQCCLPALLPQAVWGAVAGYSSFAVIYWGYRLLRHKEGLGYGDVKFLAALGAWHRWQALPLLVFLAAAIACITLAAAGMVRGKIDIKNPLPFGPFLAVAGFITGGKTLLLVVNPSL